MNTFAEYEPEDTPWMDPLWCLRNHAKVAGIIKGFGAATATGPSPTSSWERIDALHDQLVRHPSCRAATAELDARYAAELEALLRSCA
ncbi:MAG: hypothetical protein JWP74_518 [Marmoricola sp.]|nr:hypothetical protein [Marmoricola sp.]